MSEQRGGLLVLALGNPLLGDDGAGWRVAEKVRAAIEASGDGSLAAGVEVDCLDLGGLSLMERLAGYESAILIDTILIDTTLVGKSPIEGGTVACCRLADLPNPAAGHTASAHDINLQTAMEMGRRLGVPLPEVTVITIAVRDADVYEVTEELSPPVGAAVPQAVRLVLDILKTGGQDVFCETGCT